MEGKIHIPKWQEDRYRDKCDWKNYAKQSRKLI